MSGVRRGTRAVAEWKIKEVEELKELIKSHRVICVADLYKVRAQQLQDLREKLRGKAILRVAKNTLMRIALDSLKDIKPNIEKFAEQLTGSNIYIFTNAMDPFALSIFLDNNKMRTYAKAGDIAEEDIVVPAGNTGLPPGPVIAELTEVGLPTKVETGSIVITRDTVVARKGEVISPKLAAVLLKLDIKAVTLGLNLKLAYDNGLIIHSDKLKIDLNQIKEDIKNALNYARNLAYGITYPIPEVIQYSLLKCRHEALNLAVAISYPSPETIAYIISRAYYQAKQLESAISEKKS